MAGHCAQPFCRARTLWDMSRERLTKYKQACGICRVTNYGICRAIRLHIARTVRDWDMSSDMLGYVAYVGTMHKKVGYVAYEKFVDKCVDICG